MGLGLLVLGGVWMALCREILCGIEGLFILLRCSRRHEVGLKLFIAIIA